MFFDHLISVCEVHIVAWDALPQLSIRQLGFPLIGFMYCQVKILRRLYLAAAKIQFRAGFVGCTTSMRGGAWNSRVLCQDQSRSNRSLPKRTSAFTCGLPILTSHFQITPEGAVRSIALIAFKRCIQNNRWAVFRDWMVFRAPICPTK